MFVVLIVLIMYRGNDTFKWYGLNGLSLRISDTILFKYNTIWITRPSHVRVLWDVLSWIWNFEPYEISNIQSARHMCPFALPFRVPYPPPDEKSNKVYNTHRALTWTRALCLCHMALWRDKGPLKLKSLVACVDLKSTDTRQRHPYRKKKKKGILSVWYRKLMNKRRNLDIIISFHLN